MKSNNATRGSAKTVSNGETVMIESGSSAGAVLAECLVNEKQNVTIITNSAFIAGFHSGKSRRLR